MLALLAERSTYGATPYADAADAGVAVSEIAATDPASKAMTAVPLTHVVLRMS
jgi:hypothetical protein